MSLELAWDILKRATYLAKEICRRLCKFRDIVRFNVWIHIFQSHEDLGNGIRPLLFKLRLQGSDIVTNELPVDLSPSLERVAEHIAVET